jgi:putative pyruvate formate lyase activating enzyme
MTAAPGYLRLLESGELDDRVGLLHEMLGNCRLCRRRCGADRLHGERGYCGAGGTLEVSSSCVHTGEEPVLTGNVGVGNVFLGRCNLACVFCQNHTISQPGPGSKVNWETSEEKVAGLLLDFQAGGCPTAGFVSPTHFAPQVFRAVALAAREGFRLPVIYNTGGYDSMELLRALDGLVDIYLPDLKYSDPAMSLAYSDAPDYPAASREAVLEMMRQVGTLRTDPDGVAFRGLLVRLLVLPGGISGTADTLDFLARNIGNDVFISLMSQYYPSHRAREFPPLDRRLLPREYEEAVSAMERLEFHNGWVQDPVTSPDSYLPGVDFSL